MLGSDNAYLLRGPIAATAFVVFADLLNNYGKTYVAGAGAVDRGALALKMTVVHWHLFAGVAIFCWILAVVLIKMADGRESTAG